MSYDSRVLNAAMEIVQQPFVGSSAPAKERLLNRFPHLDHKSAGDMLSLCAAVEDKALDYARAVRSNRIAYSDAEQQLARDFPELDVGRIEKAINQAMYSFVR